MRFFMVGVVVAIITFFMFYASPEDVAKKKVQNELKINTPEIIQLPSVDGCEIKYVRAYSARNAKIGPDLKRHEFYIAKCGNTQTTTSIEKNGKTQTLVPTIVEQK